MIRNCSENIRSEQQRPPKNHLVINKEKTYEVIEEEAGAAVQSDLQNYKGIISSLGGEEEYALDARREKEPSFKQRLKEKWLSEED